MSSPAVLPPGHRTEGSRERWGSGSPLMTLVEIKTQTLSLHYVWEGGGRETVTDSEELYTSGSGGQNVAENNSHLQILSTDRVHLSSSAMHRNKLRPTNAHPRGIFPEFRMLRESAAPVVALLSQRGLRVLSAERGAREGSEVVLKRRARPAV